MAFASYSPSPEKAPALPRQPATVARPAQSPLSHTHTTVTPSPPAFRSSIRPSIPHAAHHKVHPRSSASHCQKSRGQTRLDPHPSAESPLSKHPPPAQSHSPPKTLPYTAPSASAPPPQSPHPSETCLSSLYSAELATQQFRS